LELTAGPSQRCPNSIQIPSQNLPVCPSIPEEFSTLSDNMWGFCIWLVDCGRIIWIDRGGGRRENMGKNQAREGAMETKRERAFENIGNLLILQ